MNKEEQILVLAALLHDIGKMVQRGDENPKRKKHEEFGEEFLREALNMSQGIKEEIIALVKSHHRLKYEGNYPKLLKILKDSDSDSAMHDRDESEGVDEKISITPLLSVYSYVDISNGNLNKWRKYYSLTILSKRGVEYPKEWEQSKNTNAKYSGVKNLLKSDIKNLKTGEKDDINTLLYYLMKYTKYIPSAVYVSVPDIPLYDHLKTTAAISLCRYRSGRNREYGMLIMGDLSGIQDFIFYHFKTDNESIVDKGGTKRLRGRSFLINLVIDSAVKYIVEELDLYEFNVLWQSGGNFLILAPNTEDIKNKVVDIKEKINKYLLTHFGRLYLSMAMEEWDATVPFNEVIENLHFKIDELKHRKFREFIHDTSFFKRDIPSGKFLCPVCGNNFVDNEGSICDFCKNVEAIGGKVVKARYILRSDESPNCDFIFSYGNRKICYELKEKIDAKDDEDKEIFSIKDFDIPPVGRIRGFKMLNMYVPTDKNGNVIGISDLISLNSSEDEYNQVSAPYGILKADVDCLGEIFGNGLKEERVTISRISELSFRMDMYFNIKVEELAKKHNIYVIFAGGDDLTVVGRYDSIIEFGKELYGTFKMWVGENANIHLSAGIAFFGEKYPIRRAVKITEKNLSNAKDVKDANLCVERGNRVGIFTYILKWDDFLKQVSLSDKLMKLQREGNISAGFSHYLLNVYRLWHVEGKPERGQFVIPSPIPYVKYYFGRRGKKGHEILETKLKDLLNLEIFENVPVAVSLWVMRRKYERKGGA